MGPYAAPTELRLGLAPASYCALAGPRPSDGGAARVAPPGPEAWDVWWEDFRQDAGADYDDLVVRVELLP